MIIVERKKNNIKITGHALYLDFGKDIVCSAVSSIIITSVNGILEIDKNAISVKNDNGVEITILKNDKVTNSLINNMMMLLEELSVKYPKNIKIKEGV